MTDLHSQWPTVTNWVWFENQLVRGDELNCGPDLSKFEAWGQFAYRRNLEDGTQLLARDLLGVNKLFFGLANGEVVSSNYFGCLVDQGIPIKNIVSVPPGHVVKVDPHQRSLTSHQFKKLGFGSRSEMGREEIGEAIRSELDETFKRLKVAIGDRPVIVTLSGGLDSTTIAALAKQHLRDVRAVTFHLDMGARDDDPDSDLVHAEIAASELGIPLEVVTVGADELLQLIDLTLIYGQDWRDFNVHCALVNAAIGESLQKKIEGTQPVLLTGDAMNELMADYEEEQYAERVYYSLPRLTRPKLRKYLTQGLDAGDREVGVYASFGIDVIQPYTLCAEVYASCPDALVESDVAKKELVESVMGGSIPENVYRRPKVRAQVGSTKGDSGVLALLAEEGIDQDWLLKRFCTLVGISQLETSTLIRAGKYKSTSSYVW